jgi:hypothetical protein
MLPRVGSKCCNWLLMGLWGEKPRKLVQFVTLFCIVQHGMPMLENEAHKKLFDFLN